MSDARPHLVFTAGNDPFELLVRFGTLSPASHAAIGIGGNLLHVHDAGVCLEPRQDWLDQEQKIVAEYEIVPDIKAELDALMHWIGQPYDVIGAAWISIRRALHYTGSPLGMASQKIPRLTCATFVMQADPTGAKIPEWLRIRRDIAAPADLLRAAQYGPSFERVR